MTVAAKEVETETVVEGLSEDQVGELNNLKPDFEPSGDDAPKKQDDSNAQSVQMVTMILGGVFEVLAVRMGEHWRLHPKEASAIAVPAVEVLDKYVPDFENGPEVALIAAAGMVVLPRVMMQKKLSDKQGADTNGKESESKPAE